MKNLRALYRVAALLAFAIGLCAPSRAETPADYRPIRFEHLGVEDGLAVGRVHCILQDARGFMWFGTQNGLSRWDGVRFTTYTHDARDPSSLSDSFIFSLAEDRGGTLWAGTFGGGLNRFDRETGAFTPFRHEAGKPGSLSHDRVAALLVDSRGTLWVGTYGGGLNRFDPRTGTFVALRHDARNVFSLPDDRVNALAEDAEGRIWVGTNGGGVALYDRDAGRFYRYDAATSGLTDDRVFSILVDADGTLWAGTNSGGLNRFDKASRRFTAFRHDPKDPRTLSDDWVKALVRDAEGTLWAATGNGLSRLRPDGSFQRYIASPYDPGSLSESSLLTIHQDRGSVVWIGSYGGGVDRFSLAAKPFRTFRRNPDDDSTLKDAFVLSFCEDHAGRLWVGTRKGGLHRADLATGRFTQFLPDAADLKLPGDLQVTSIFEDSSNQLWVGTYTGGLSLFDEEKGRFVEHHRQDGPPDKTRTNSVWGIVEDGTGALWLATYGGLSRYDPATKTFRFFRKSEGGLADDSLMSIAKEPGRDVLWLGTRDGGIHRFDIGSETFQRFPVGTATGLAARSSCITVAKDGTVWAGTFGDGLHRLAGDGKTFERFLDESSPARNNILGIQEDAGGQLWLATNRGLSRFDPKKRTFRSFDSKDGLLSEFTFGASGKGRDGTLYFGGIRGFNAIEPGKLKDNPHAPPVYVTGFRKFNRDVRLGRDITTLKELPLSHADNVISFDFAALDFTAPARNRYRVMLEGFDPAFVETASPQVTYTNLSPGRYVLRVQGANADGVWNEQGASLAILVSPPFWRTPWFLALVGLLVLALALLLHRMRLNALHLRQEELERLVEERTAQLADANLRLERLSYSDALTGIANRRHFEEVLDEEWRRAQRSESPLSLILIDIDRFKDFNDRYGHPAGDEALTRVARKLAESLKRAGDLVARYGGEEFAAVLANLSAEDAAGVAERLREAVERLHIVHAGATAGVVTISVGVATVKPEPRSELSAFVRKADEALYVAKGAGRNRVEAAI
ncbi:MAG: diguanylate cyclase [Acidobacteria bacterium]|nr:diguanylate cyclase [Acidobacteriota bacterium]